jgi:hypothetical protein
VAAEVLEEGQRLGVAKEGPQHTLAPVLVHVLLPVHGHGDHG